MIDKRIFFSVSREGFLHWTVMWHAGMKGVIVARFWTRRGAERCCVRLSRFMELIPAVLKQDDDERWRSAVSQFMNSQ